MDRNPSPPSSDDEEEGSVGDAIGDTVYSKHWVLSTLANLIEVISDVGDGEMLTDLDEEMENEICKIWDISVNEDVALFLQNFSVPETFLRVISHSRCPRLTEICVGILANMACFHEPCVSISNNEDLRELLLLLLSDSDPPTLLETSRLLLTCLSRLEVASLWVEKIRKHPSVRQSICFIMMSSTNVELLVKVGEVVDKLFDLDEDLMLSWIEADGQELEGQLSSDGEDEKTALELILCVLEATKQVRADNPEGLEVYIHILQLLTTIDKGIQAIVYSSKAGEETWHLLSDLMCNELCQGDDPPFIIQEQKTVLASVLAVMSAVFSSQAELDYIKIEKNTPLISSLIQVLQHLEDCQKKPAENSERSDAEESSRPVISEEDLHLKILQDVCCEFLSNVLLEMTKETTLQGLKHGRLNEKKCLCAFRNLLPLYSTSVKSFVEVLHDADQTLAEKLEKSFPALRDNT